MIEESNTFKLITKNKTTIKESSLKKEFDVVCQNEEEKPKLMIDTISRYENFIKNKEKRKR